VTAITRDATADEGSDDRDGTELLPSALTSSMSRRRKVKNDLATLWLWASLVVAVVPLGLVMYYVLQRGSSVFGPNFLTSDIPVSRQKVGPGMGPAVAGTLLITGVATLMAVPLGVLAAVYLNEYGGKRRFAATVRFMSQVMTGVPSIVMGLFVYTVWVLRFGQSGFAGSLALGCLMLPIVIRTTEEMLRLVPDDLRQASYALGNRKWRTILTVVLPAAVGGITSGCMLAVARAAGETAPLLFTIGIVSKTNPNLFEGSNTALSAQIFRNASVPFQGPQERAWGAALTLILLVLLLTVAARWVSARFATRHSS
jgi:phosphate transport system permease protein